MDNDKFLLENAIDFFKRSTNAYKIKDYKGAILNLWPGLLLLFKYKLYLINPAMIFKDIFKFIKTENGKTKFIKPEKSCNDLTVDFYEIIKRLESLGEVNSLIFKYKSYFEKIQKIRNRIEHYIFEVKEDDFLIIFHEIMPFINNFIEDELSENISDLFNENWADFLSIKSVSQTRFKKMKDFIKENEPSLRDIKHGEEFITHHCDSCGKGTMILQDDVFYCKFCENTETYNICSRCGEYILENDWDGFIDDLNTCQRCFDDICESSK
jgi:hypothetical protein